MSYLNPLRIHFAGEFTAAPSTVNNDVRHFDNAHFMPNFQLPGEGTMNGWWNPNGDHRFEFACPATAVLYGDGTVAAPGSDPALLFTVQSATGLGKPPAKIVDLDPQQQMVSMVFGLDVTIVAAPGAAPLLRGAFRPAAFTDLWQRRPTQPGDEGLSVMYQSVIESLVWGDVSSSRFLGELRAAATDGILSIRFNLDGYSMDPGTPGAPNPKFTKGRLVGTIGPGALAEPRHFVQGRHLAGSRRLNFSVALLDEPAGKVRIDLGNALPVDPSTGQMLDIGVLSLVCRPTGAAALTLGNIEYRAANWYTNTSGIVDLPAGRSLTGPELAAVRTNPLVLVLDPPGTAPAVDAASEANGGVHVRADMFVGRLNPGDDFPVDFYASQFGQPLAAAKIDLQHQDFAAPPTSPPGVTPTPQMGIPQSALTFPEAAVCDANGRATVTLHASDPRNSRGYIDGQIYFVLYAPDGLDLANPNDFLSILVWNAFASDVPPTWYGSMQRIFQLYGNLYPIMRDSPDFSIDLGSYDSVSSNRVKILGTLSLPVTDPHYMPVTRDLSEAKRSAMVSWLTNVGRDGKPLLGTAPAAVVAGHQVSSGSKVLAASELTRVRLPRKRNYPKP
jgi:hypothetical protein